MWNILKRGFNGKQTETVKLSVPGGLRASWTQRAYSPLIKEGYEKNVIVYRCISMIARGIASVPWLLYMNDIALTEHPLLNLLKRPNEGDSGASFWEAVVTYFLLSGNAYIHVVKNGAGLPVELQVLRPEKVRVLTHDGSGVAGYEYDGQRLAKANVIHLRMLNPLNDVYGLSPMEVAAMAIDQHNAVSSHNLALLQNGGRPSGVFIWKGRQDDWGLSAEQKADLREQITDLYAGHTKAGKVMVLEGDVEWKEIGMTPKDLDFVEGKYVAAREIAQAFGVPPMLVGVPGDVTYANYKEARFHLWEDTILPLLERIQTALGQMLFGAYEDNNLRFSYDADAIPALAPRREGIWKKLSAAEFLTDNEKRVALGYNLKEEMEIGNEG